MREKQERLEKSEEFRIKQLHFADNEGIMSEEIGSDESYDRKAVSESRWQVETGAVSKVFPLSEPVMKVTRFVPCIVRLRGRKKICSLT